MDLYSTPFLTSWPTFDLQECFKEKEKVVLKPRLKKSPPFVEVKSGEGKSAKS